MEVKLSNFSEIYDMHLKKAHHNTSADWVAVLSVNNEKWVIISHSNISESIIEPLEIFISDNKIWFNSALNSIRIRSKSTKKYLNKLNCEKVFCFASKSENKIIVVGANNLNKKERLSFKQLAQSLEFLSPQLILLNENLRISIELEKKNEAQEIIEDRLIQAAKLAAVGEMAAGVAHELNNPLTTVSGFAELILETMPKESPNYEDMTLILTEARRARAVVRRLLDYSRHNEILRLEADINEILSKVIALVHHLAVINNVKISIVLWNEIPKVRLDSNQIQQVFLNLIHNAIQSMPDGGDLNIETQVNTKEGHQWVTIIIRDNGHGIDEKDLIKISKPFFTTKKSGEGTGLGLSISYRIIADHGGYIDVETKLEVGTTFSVWLPLVAINHENGEK